MKKGIAVISFILVACGLYLYYSYNPAEYSFFPQCPFLCLTGLKCPGCGSQRAIHSLLHLDLSAAVGYNCLLVFFIPYIILSFISNSFKQKLSTLHNILFHHIVIKAIFVIVILWAIFRNIYGW